MTAKKQPTLQYVLLAILFTAACAYLVRVAASSFPDYFGIEAVEWPFVPLYTHGQPHAEFVREYAQAAGLKENDVLVSINGQPFTGLAVFGEAVRLAKPGDSLTVFALSNGESTPHIAVIPLVQKKNGRAGFVLFFMKVLMPFFCVFLGAWVIAVRPRDVSAWLLFLTLQFFSVVAGTGIESWGPVARDFGQLYRTGFSAAWPICMFLFGLYFPEPFPPKIAASWKWAKLTLIPILSLFGILAMIADVGLIENFAAVASLESLLQHTSRVFFVLGFVAIGCFFAAIGSKANIALAADAKRRLRLLYFGTTISMAPACILTIVQAFKGSGELEKIFPEWVVIFSLLLMLLFPVTLAYVIVVHRAMDVHVVVRQGLQYTLATKGVRIVQIALVAIMVIVAIRLMGREDVTDARKLTIIALMVFCISSLRKIAVRVRAWIDRRFFRDAYNSEQILSSLSDEVRTIVETRPLLERVTAKIAESLHVPRVAVFLPQDGFYRPAYALGYDGIPPTQFRDSAVTIERLRKEADPARIYLDDEKSWVNTEIPKDERQNLAELGPQVLLPLTVKDKLLGVVALGEKRSEEPYSGNDLRLLKSVASQTALALSNAQLSAVIAEEVARREKLNREIEIAREVQERLFPQRLPEIAGLRYFGHCRTALGVGGDYYDFLPLPDGKLGVALGDVSGKGIAAALTMASLQASLRAEAMRAGDDIAGLIGRVNNMVYDASTEDRYATLFYAQYDANSHWLTYVNAGHCPPILLRSAAAGHAVERLDKAGGTVVGLVPDVPYDQAKVQLDPGDLLVIYTDGFSEAMNPKLEEWGEKRLLDAVQSCEGLSSQEAISKIMQAADAFASGAPQSDDMTLVILRAV
jgi:phosphoserine phosphatase RsbU/P